MSNLIEIVKTGIVWSTRKGQDQMQGLRVKWFSIESRAPLFVFTSKYAPTGYCKAQITLTQITLTCNVYLTLQCLSNFGKGYFYERRPTLQTALYIAETLNLSS
jgi:hypothetical protein